MFKFWGAHVYPTHKTIQILSYTWQTIFSEQYSMTRHNILQVTPEVKRSIISP